MRKFFVLLLIVCGAVAVPLLAVEDGSPLEPTEVIQKAVANMPAMREVISVELSEVELGGESTTLLTVIYLTAETDELGYRLETLDVFRVIAEVMKDITIDADMITLVPSVSEDSSIEVVSADTDSVFALYAGQITRTDFINQISITPGGHQSPTDGDQGSNSA